MKIGYKLSYPIHLSYCRTVLPHCTLIVLEIEEDEDVYRERLIKVGAIAIHWQPKKIVFNLM